MRNPTDEPLFRELDHTADLGIEVEADSPAELFRRSGLALYSLMVVPAGIAAREVREVRVVAPDWPDLLHDWLSRLLGAFLTEGFIATEIEVAEISEKAIDSRLFGEKLHWGRHEFLTEIKAVTYHELNVECRGGRWHARIIFDV